MELTFCVDTPSYRDVHQHSRRFHNRYLFFNIDDSIYEYIQYVDHTEMTGNAWTVCGMYRIATLLIDFYHHSAAIRKLLSTRPSIDSCVLMIAMCVSL